MKHLVAIVCSLFLFLTAFSQATTRRFPASINNPSINITAPFISLDGSTLLFTSDYADDGTLIYVSQRDAGDWKAPVELPKLYNAKTNFSKGYTLSADG